MYRDYIDYSTYVTDIIEEKTFQKKKRKIFKLY